MKISLNWLSDYIDLKDYRDKLDDLSSLLTQAGLEVEGMENPSQHWDHVVVGQLIEVGKHPDADKLTLCKVDVGGKEPSQIICGAKNHKQGDYVVAALPGAVLPGEFKIKKSKIRGVESHGMLCSEKELGLSEESAGIIILKEGKAGTAFKDVCDNVDVVFDLNVTPNRADCLSHMGLARELSSLLDRPVKPPEAQLKESGKDIDSQIKVELKDSEACPRYCGRMLRGVKVGPSPSWLKNRLESVGVNSINNVVDITNYVLFEYGQPLHAFDFQFLEKQQIVIEKAKGKEKITTLDGTEVELRSSDLLIRDGAKAVALAGVVGGQNSGVSESTKDIFLESAFFTAKGVRQTARFHGIETDSCYRFSRGVDPEQTLNAMNRACHLIQELAGGEVQKGHIDLYPKPLQPDDIFIKADYVGERLGYEVTNEDFEIWMKRLGCIVAQEKDQFRVTPPIYRWDLQWAEDLVEEYGRLKGYDHIEEVLPTLKDEPTNHEPHYVFEQRVNKIMSSMGCYQAVNYAFIAEGQSQKIWGDKCTDFGMTITPQSSVVVQNPISEELSVMRESLLPGLLKNIIYNDHHGNHCGRLFEMGACHFKRGEDYSEEPRLAVAFWGRPEGLWENSKTGNILFDLKSSIEGLLTKIGAKSWRWEKAGESCPSGFHPGQSAKLFYEGKVVGVMGAIHPLILSENKVRGEAAWAELNFSALAARQPRNAKFRGLPKFPAVERDIALLAPEDLASSEIGGQIKKSAGPLLQDFEVFDIYQDKELKSAGRRSIAFRLHFQSEKETLSDDQVNQLRDTVLNDLCQKLPVEVR